MPVIASHTRCLACQHVLADHFTLEQRKANPERSACANADCDCAGFAYAPTPTATERVHHPNHYHGASDHEAWDCLRAWGLEGYALRWNAAKYIARAHLKGNDIEDLRKARNYLTKELANLGYTDPT